MMKEQLKYKDRRNTDCEKWDGLKEQFGEDGLLALWVADMDFESPQCVQEALRRYLESGVYGYYKPQTGYMDAFIEWEKEYHDYEVKRDWLRFVPGVVPAIYWMVQTMTKENEHVLIMPPVYHPFFDSVTETGRKLVKCPLAEEKGIYTMDFERMEYLIQKHHVKLFILCSPHNPAGRVWTREELKRALDICRKYHVFVIADEIHHDLIIGERRQTTAATVGAYDDMLVTVTAATKTFNIAGLQNAFLIIQDEKLRDRFDETVKKIHLQEGNAPGYVAVQAAYEGGREWLELVTEKIRQNYRCLKEQLGRCLPEAVLTPLEGTYLAWINLKAYIPGTKTREIVQQKCRLGVDFGEWFGGDDYASYIRMNLATKTEYIEEAVKRLADALK